jgi:hypothetical protein
MFGGETTHVVKPEDRRAFIPSDVMSLSQYIEFKRKFNERLPAENKKIEAKNVKAKEYSQPFTPKLDAYPLETVTMISESTFIVTLVDYKRVVIPRGIFECPVELADHWYLAAHKVQAFVHPNAAPKTEEPKQESPLKKLAKK